MTSSPGIFRQFAASFFVACALACALGLWRTSFDADSSAAAQAPGTSAARPRLFGPRPNPPQTPPGTQPAKAPKANGLPATPPAAPPSGPPSPTKEEENGGYGSKPATATSTAESGAKPSASLPAASLQADGIDEVTPASPEILFEGWPQPALALVISGEQWGYIEPCGCTGLANQKGGIARRHTLLNELAAKEWPLVPVDVGNQVRRFGRQAEIKFQTMAQSLKEMNYGGVGFGPDDLRLSFGELVAAIVSANPKQPSPFVSANIDFAGLVPRVRVVTAGGKRVGITAVLGTTYARRVASGDLTILPAETALARVQAELRELKCDLYVLLSNGTVEESKALAEKFPIFHVVVTAGISGEPTREAEELNNRRTLLIQTGNKGMYAGVVGLFPGDKRVLRYQRVPLDARFADSRPMLDLMKGYQRQLETAGLPGLEIAPRRHPTGHAYVGSGACADCHSNAYEVWKNSPHAHATDSLVTPGERSEIPRHFDPECLSCHVTGWNPQQYYPYQGGYLDLQRSSALKQNGCENCHGPGSAHVAAENGDTSVTPEVLKKLRDQMKTPLATAERLCMECHDLDNSPDFHVRGAFEKYWKQIEHKGKD